MTEMKKGETNMTGQIFKLNFFGSLIVAILVLANSGSAQTSASGISLIGAWDMTITFRDCTTGAAMRERPGLISFMFGGILQEFGTGQQIPQNRTEAQGSWSHNTGRSYSAVAKAFRFNPDGSLAGTAKLYRLITLNDDGNSFEAAVNSEIYDVNGVLLATGCATESGTRLK
jgi:hypothetical protein